MRSAIPLYWSVWRTKTTYFKLGTMPNPIRW